jgi:hypothetical protein
LQETVALLVCGYVCSRAMLRLVATEELRT